MKNLSCFWKMPFIFLILCGSTVSAQTDEWASYTAGHHITSIEDDNDNLWVGTLGGVAHVNKNAGSLIFYNKLNSALTSLSVGDIAVDRDKNVWIACDSSLLVYNGEIWKTYNSQNSPLPGAYIVAVEVDSGNNIWVGQFDNGIFEFNGTEWKHYSSDSSSLPSNNIRSMEISINSDILIGTYSSGLIIKTDMNWEIYNTRNSGIAGNYVGQIKTDSKGKIWLGTDNGLCSFDGTIWEQFNTSNSEIPGNRIMAIEIDENDTVWLGCFSEVIMGRSVGYGLVSYDGATWTQFTTDNSGLIYNDINALLYDRGNGLFVGSSEGLAVYKNGGWTEGQTYETELVYRYATAIAADCTQNIWIGSFNNEPSMQCKFVKFDGKNWSILKPDDFGESLISDLAVDANNMLYAGFVNYGLASFDGSSWIKLSDNHIEALALDTANTLWIGHHQTIAKLENLAVTEYANIPDFGVILDACIDKNNTKWFAGTDGILAYDENSFMVYDHENSDLPDTRFHAIAADHNNIIWAGGWDCLAFFDGVNWTAYDQTDLGIHFMEISAIEVDQNNIKWIGAESNSLIRYDDTAFSVVSPFDDNRQIERVNRIAVDRNNNKWLATDEGIYVYRKGGVLNTEIADYKNPKQPEEFRLFQNYPNPFNSSTIIEYNLSESSHVNVTIYDITGRRITELVNTNQSAGVYRIKWNGKNAALTEVASGVYFYRITTKDFDQVSKMVLLR
ncbi:T9SS type A sorting domain-containing protein [candidate division KSB1 bacterium]|nr:T9SS type A sorting domain-containing protein [candidate division KSB1 bacterium]